MIGRKSFLVFRTRVIMFNQIVLATSEASCSHIEQKRKRYGNTEWPLVYQTDTRVRLEHVPRICRSAGLAHVQALQVVVAPASAPFCALFGAFCCCIFCISLCFWRSRYGFFLKCVCRLGVRAVDFLGVCPFGCERFVRFCFEFF